MNDPFEKWYSKHMGEYDPEQLYGYAGLRLAYEADRKKDPFDHVEPCPLEMQLHVKKAGNWYIDDQNNLIVASGWIEDLDPGRDEETRLYQDGGWRVV